MIDPKSIRHPQTPADYNERRIPELPRMEGIGNQLASMFKDVQSIREEVSSLKKEVHTIKGMIEEIKTLLNSRLA